MNDPALRETLCPADAEACEALFDAGLDARAVPPPAGARAGRIVSLLSLLGSPAPGERDPGLALRVMSRLDAPGEARLTPDDEEALDAYVSAGFRARSVPASLRARAARIDELVQLVAHTPATGEALAGLAARTLEAVERSPAPAAREREPVLARIGGFRLADLVSVAAVLLLGVSAFWPVASAIGAHQRRRACAGNYASLASAFGAYASDNRDSLPIAAGFGGPTWWDVGTSPDRSNSANLFTLARTGYEKLRTLACAGNPSALVRDCGPRDFDWSCPEEVSYSYQVVYGPERPLWRVNPGTVILADRSPVIEHARRGQRVSDLQNSRNHGGTGQWALRADGSGQWLDTPVTAGDNIWLPRTVEQIIAAVKAQGARLGGDSVDLDITIKGSEMPSAADDAFLGP